MHELPVEVAMQIPVKSNHTCKSVLPKKNFYNCSYRVVPGSVGFSILRITNATSERKDLLMNKNISNFFSNTRYNQKNYFSVHGPCRRKESKPSPVYWNFSGNGATEKSFSFTNNLDKKN